MKRSATSAAATILMLAMSASAAADDAAPAVAAASDPRGDSYSAADCKAFLDANRATHRILNAERRIAGGYSIERAGCEARITPADGTWKVLREIWGGDGGH